MGWARIGCWATFVAALSALESACKGPAPSAPEEHVTTVVRVDEERLLAPNGTPLVLRGVAFGNRVWTGDPLPRVHHDESDYERVAAMGMNAVRFYLNYRTFEDDAAPGQWLDEGFRWLDDNVKWAQAHGIYLVLNMHVPHGGHQSGGGGAALWTDAELQRRLIALWRAIAERYRGEPIIAGYGLVNEPFVKSSPTEWRELAERIIEAVREVDAEHAFFVERVHAVAPGGVLRAPDGFFRVRDPNVVYEFHFYDPLHFTHQGSPWSEVAAAQARYPDDDAVEVDVADLQIAAWPEHNPRLPAGDSDWQLYQSGPITVTDPKLVLGRPLIICDQVREGRAYFDDLLVEQLGEGNEPAEVISRVGTDTPRGWGFRSAEGTGALTLASVGHGDETSLSVTGTTSRAEASSSLWNVRPVQGATYRLSGWMKGEKVPQDALCRFVLVFLTSSAPLHARNRGYLEHRLDQETAWGRRERVPLFVGEFGLIRAAFEDDRGGLRWTEDMLELLLARGLHFTYHDYHEDYFGMYYGDGTPIDPSRANQPLMDLFRRKLGGEL